MIAHSNSRHCKFEYVQLLHQFPTKCSRDTLPSHSRKCILGRVLRNVAAAAADARGRAVFAVRIGLPTVSRSRVSLISVCRLPRFIVSQQSRE